MKMQASLYRNILLFCGGLGFNLTVHAQKVALWVAPVESDSPLTRESFLKTCRSEVAASFLAYGQFSIVDRTHFEKVEQERELQKSESFIDGKVVEQGKATGAAFIVLGKYYPQEENLEITVVDVATENIIEKQNARIDPESRFLQKKIRQAVFELSGRWMGAGRIKVVRSLEDKGNETRRLLLAGGSGHGIREGVVMEAFCLEEVDLDGEKMERMALLGELRVDQVENEHFSNARVKKGGKEIYNVLMDNRKLYARLREK